MIRKLRFRFILVALISVLVVLSATMAAINIYNYSRINNEAQYSLKKAVNQVTRFYGGNPGGQGSNPGEQPGGDWNWGDMYDESLMREHYFIVCFDEEGNINDTRSRYNGIFAGGYDPNTGEYTNNQEEYKELATKIYKSKSKSGTSGNLWYRREQKNNNTYLAFIDATERMNNFKTFLYTSMGVSGISYTILAGLIIIASFIVFRTSEESYRKQKAFITNASHELKTPLTIISTDLDIIEMDNVKNEWTSSIRDQVSRLVTMTNQLVTLSKLEENDYKNFDFVNFDMSKLAHECADAFAPTYEKNGFKFVNKIKDGINIRGNQYLLNELFYIFLDNALKYAKENGEISLELKNNKKSIEIIFSNDINEDDSIDLKQMFEIFYRSPNSNKKEGSGIGLSIAKEIIDLHKGKVDALLKEGKIYFIVTF